MRRPGRRPVSVEGGTQVNTRGSASVVGYGRGTAADARSVRSMTREHWKARPEAQDFPAAASYLSLLVGPAAGAKLAKALQKQPKLQRFAVKDILRASGLPLLAVDDPEVAADLKKVKVGTKLSPVLLVAGTPLWIADGYHRVCASYHLNEKVLVPCRIVSRKG